MLKTSVDGCFKKIAVQGSRVKSKDKMGVREDMVAAYLGNNFGRGWAFSRDLKAFVKWTFSRMRVQESRANNKNGSSTESRHFRRYCQSEKIWQYLVDYREVFGVRLD